ncbi:unnamed protein product [Fraxinus pennsylvanica]|uniref:Uncharacterized protein n=1 Tax=Fraxinus pennsylvanica TaxID=56036 RepID=A0AAD2E0D3_9LAMI|nr:unnamed protein product [Fraxinus pennsylvanica]
MAGWVRPCLSLYITPTHPLYISVPRAVREAIDGVLATTAKGRSRWNRTILTNWLKLYSHSRSIGSQLDERAFTDDLEEVTDYIAALETCVQAMCPLTELLSVSSVVIAYGGVGGGEETGGEGEYISGGGERTGGEGGVGLGLGG